ncbi:MAG: hypothetical protein K2W79_07185 [Hydrotalea flava]|uniref:hypothetical protein n=1 Tax=Hydrotalea sp. AMD TaxID=2501297 RepID=UPI00257C12E3|nr:hypothetical protein [Hydrotalea sp. AMD]MBY0348026.1 hypothetical protein [Hydrotalea flava]
MKFIIYLLLFVNFFNFTNQLNAQGCVAIRSSGSYTISHDDADTLSNWDMIVNNRYFKSYKHFIGTDQQKQRVENGTNVINHQYTMDVAIVRNIDRRWSFMLDIPLEANSRSSLYEHDKIHRYVTHSFGVGDIRFAVYRWLFNPDKFSKGNLQAGLGLKLPTGDYRFQDYFHTSDSTKVLGPVDQSIQLGDGGTGITLEINGYYNFNSKWSLYGNFYYLSNPRDQNGVSTARGGLPPAMSVKVGSDVMSVPDQYMVRGGLNYMTHQFSASLGLRDECLPVHDLIGGSDGFRRPGFIISAEPGFTYRLHKVSLYAYIPIALIRDRTQSVPDKNQTMITGIYTHGDAAFSDYALDIGMNVHF